MFRRHLITFPGDDPYVSTPSIKLVITRLDFVWFLLSASLSWGRIREDVYTVTALLKN